MARMYAIQVSGRFIVLFKRSSIETSGSRERTIASQLSFTSPTIDGRFQRSVNMRFEVDCSQFFALFGFEITFVVRSDVVWHNRFAHSSHAATSRNAAPLSIGDNCASSASRSRILKPSYLAHETGAAPIARIALSDALIATSRSRARKLVYRLTWETRDFRRPCRSGIEDSARFANRGNTVRLAPRIKSRFISPPAPIIHLSRVGKGSQRRDANVRSRDVAVVL